MPPDDLAVLSLPELKLYRLTDVPDPIRLGRIMAVNLDSIFEDVRDELDRGGPKRPDEQPKKPN
jgi:hypothetical protein